MKKQLLTFLALFISGIISAQVGIGTTTPTQALDVETNEAGGTAIDINNTGTGDPKINLQLNGTTTFSVGIDNDDADKLKIGTSAPETNTRVTIDNTGNVGVGTSTPGAKLDVDGSATFNESGAAVNFRVESDANTNMLFIDGTNNRVGVGTGVPDATFQVNGSFKLVDGNQLNGKVLTSDANGVATWQTAAGVSLPAGTSGQTLRYDGTNWVANSVLFNNGTNVGVGTATPGAKLDVDGSAIFNESGAAVNFRVESDANANMLFVDGTNNGIGVNTSTPASTLDIQGSMGYKVNTLTSATTLNATHNVLLCNNGPYTLSLPAAAANVNRVYRIKNIDAQSDVITIDGNSSETIDGALTYALQPYKHSITIISDGANWHIIENLSEGGSQVGTISTINCAGATNNGTLVSGAAASGVSSVIAYTNGNAGPHNGQTVISTGVTGLTATLAMGTFVAGNGSLTYTITGTPISTGTATFAINIGGQTCNLTRTVGVASSGGTAVVSTWTSTVGCSVGAGTNNSPAGVIRGGVNETMAQGVAAPASASITLVANVTTTGTYTITTNTLNGVTFSASGTFGATGNQTVTLTPSGTPTAAGNFKWATVLTPSIDVYGSVSSTNAPLGSTYTTHFNGISGGVSANNLLATYTTGETFNNNATCASKRISAQGCAGVGTVTDGGRTYNTVTINGQCWLQSNLITAPSVYNGYATTSWTNTSPGDQGYWGYYHDGTTDGTAGWKSTEPAANEGRLYQWCGAMDATISERSRGICPAGWHVPSDCEWMYLEHGQGMSIAQQTTDNAWRADGADNQGTPGYKLRSQGSGQTNVSNFSGLLAGLRYTYGPYNNRTSFGYWWSSSATGATTASYRFLATGYRGVYRDSNNKALGFSVRCLKD